MEFDSFLMSSFTAFFADETPVTTSSFVSSGGGDSLNTSPDIGVAQTDGGVEVDKLVANATQHNLHLGTRYEMDFAMS